MQGNQYNINSIDYLALHIMRNILWFLLSVRKYFVSLIEYCGILPFVRKYDFCRNITFLTKK